MKNSLCLLGLVLAGCTDVTPGTAPRGEQPGLPLTHPPLEGPSSAPSSTEQFPPLTAWTWGFSPVRSDQGDTSSSAATSEGELSSSAGNTTPLPVSLSEEGSIPLVPAPPGSVPVRGRKRMDLDQIGQSIRGVTGGIGWTEVVGGKEVDMWVQLGATLGKPDYVVSTQEDLSPSTLFEKFLGDAARSVCHKLMLRETETPSEQRVFLLFVAPTDTSSTHPEGVTDTLRALLLRWHGRNYDPDATQLVPWQWLFDSTVHITGDPMAGWNVVCVGLMTHPDFYSY